MVEHSIADQKVPGSNPGVPSLAFFPIYSLFIFHFYSHFLLLTLSYVNVILPVAQYLFVIPVTS